ncbi:MAG: MFS transporter, partial [Planctomycetota bacterium]
MSRPDSQPLSEGEQPIAESTSDIASDQSPEQQETWSQRTVWGVALTSFFGDFCYETATAVLPGFCTLLALPASILGMIEGIADGVASLMKIFAGYLTDRIGRRKTLVLVGYALTAIGHSLMAIATLGAHLLAFRTFAWIGKGLRGPLR